MKQHHILEGLNPQQRISNLTMTTCLEKAIPLQCTFLQGIINFFLQLNKFQITTEKSRSAHGMMFHPQSTAKKFLGNVLQHHNLHTMRKTNNGARLMIVRRTNRKQNT